MGGTSSPRRARFACIAMPLTFIALWTSSASSELARVPAWYIPRVGLPRLSNAKGRNEMFARVTRYEGSPSELEAGIKLIKETIAPAAKRLQGFKGGYWLLDRASGKGFSVTLFESESTLHATEDDAAQLRSRASSVVKITAVERYEVVAEAEVEDLAAAR